MKMSFLVFITLMSLVTAAEAATCNYNPNNNLVENSPYGTLNISNNIEGTANYTGKLISPELTKCDDAISGRIITAEEVRSLYERFYFNQSTHIDFTKSAGDYSGGGKYYKLKNTSSNFINRFGYIHFRVSSEDDKNSATLGPSSMELRDSTNVSPNGGIKVDLIGIRFATDTGIPIAGPLEEIGSLSIELGYIYTSFRVEHNGALDSVGGGQKAYITLNIKPSLAESCSVNSQTVQLPEVPAGNLKSAGEEIGGVSFNVIARCGSAAGEPLMYTMIDNNAPLNVRSDVLTNTVPETKNVGVAVYDDNGARVITHNTTGVLGILPGGVNPSVSKRFLARYHKLDNLPVKPGVLNAQATILVNYK